MTSRVVMALFVVVALAVGAGCRKHDCSSPTAPCSDPHNLTGTWSGTSTYINAPFTMTLRQTDTRVTGQYQDQKDAGSVSGTLVDTAVTLDVNFGDTGIRFTGTVMSSSRVSGEIFVPALGGRRFPFDMTR